MFETNFFGALINVLSLAAWTPTPTAYAASKAALWSATNALRHELAAQRTTVTSLVVGMVDTPLTERFDVPKVAPRSVVDQTDDGVVAGASEVLADADTRAVKTLLGGPVDELDARVREALRALDR